MKKRFLLLMALFAVFCAVSAFSQDAGLESEDPEESLAAEPEKKLKTVQDIEGFIEKPFSVSVGASYSNYERHTFIPMLIACVDYDVTPMFAFGAHGGINFSFEEENRAISSYEIVAFSRFYVFDCVIKMFRIRPYIQTGFGIYSGSEPDAVEAGNKYGAFDLVGGVYAGARVHLTETWFKSWFGDLSVRYGYPYQFGVTLLVGHSFLP
jgi:hypothetical protein